MGDLRSIESHFMLFSGVSCPKSALIIAAFWVLERRLESAQVPKYTFPLAFIFASRPDPLPVLPVGVGVVPAAVVDGVDPDDPGWHWL